MTYVAPRMLSYEDFPESTLSAPGMRVHEADLTPRYGTARLQVPYAHKSGRDLHLQIILPPRPHRFPDVTDDVYPTLLYVQGSAFHEQELGQTLPALADFARRGYVIAIVEYRPSELAPFPAQALDARTAARWLRDHAAEFHVDPRRMAMWGDSSGGHTALMLWATPDDPRYSDEPVTDPLALRCFVDYYGPTDIATMNDEPSTQDHRGPDSPEGYLIGRRDVTENPDLVAPTVIAGHVRPAAEKPLPPLLMMHGSKDRLVPFGQSVRLYEAAVQADQDVTFVQLKGSDHGGPAFWQTDVLDLVDDFLRRHLW